MIGDAGATPKLILDELGKDEMTGHGFRSAASSMLYESSLWNVDAIERQLAHVDNDSVRRAFAIGNVGAITATCADRKHKICILHDPKNDNKAHTSVRQFPREDILLLELLAADAWSELVLNATVSRGANAAPDEPAGRPV